MLYLCESQLLSHIASFYLHLVFLFFLFIRVPLRVIESLDVLSVLGFHSHNITRPRRHTLPSACLCVTTESLSTPCTFPSSLQTPEGTGSYHLLQYSFFSLHFFKF